MAATQHLVVAGFIPPSKAAVFAAELVIRDMANLRVIVFDVNKPLELRTLEPVFERIFGVAGAMHLWFANLVMYSTAYTMAGCYVPFTDVGSAAMTILANFAGHKE